jgi:glycosyltransferase involved in cell wall biosynthesis
VSQLAVTDKGTTLSDHIPTVAIVSPFPPPYGGMALQAEKLYKNLISSGIKSFCVKVNVSFPRLLKFLEKAKGVRTAVRFIFFITNLSSLNRATVIHIFGASYWYFFLVVAPAVIAARLMKKKIILNYRGGEAEEFLARWGFLAIPFLKKAEIIAVPSHFLKEIFERVSKREVMILPNLIDLEIFQYRERARLRPIIIVSRQLEPRYNVTCALKAFRIIKEVFPAAQLKVAGSGSEEHKLKALRQEMSLQDVFFLGALSHNELAPVYHECEIMVNPSNYDNFPGSVLEAFACGLPVVTTKVGGIPYMVKDGETGILVAPDDHEALAKGVISLLQNPTLANSFSVSGRKVAEEYSWRKVKEVFFRAYGINGKKAFL